MASGHRLTRIGNRATVMRLIWKEPGISRVEVAARVGLSEATVSRIVRELIEANYVVESEAIADGSRGKNATSLLPNGQARHAVSFHLDDGSVEVGVVAMDGTICESRVVSKDRLTVPQLTDLVSTEVAAAAKEYLVVGVGVSLTGAVDSQAGVVKRSAVYAWEDIALREILQQKLPVPCFITSDTKAALLAEKWVGAGRGSDNLLYLLIGEHLGMSMALNGQIVEGQYTMAGEISAALDGNGGRLANRLFRIIDERSGMRSGVIPRLSVADLVERVLEGDLLAVHVIDGLLEALAPFIVNLMLVSDPKWVILGGVLGAHQDIFVRPLQQRVEELDIRGLPSLSSRLVPSELRGKGSLIGAARLVVSALLRGEIEINDIEAAAG